MAADASLISCSSVFRRAERELAVDASVSIEGLGFGFLEIFRGKVETEAPLSVRGLGCGILFAAEAPTIALVRGNEETTLMKLDSSFDLTKDESLDALGSRLLFRPLAILDGRGILVTTFTPLLLPPPAALGPAEPPRALTLPIELMDAVRALAARASMLALERMPSCENERLFSPYQSSSSLSIMMRWGPFTLTLALPRAVLVERGFFGFVRAPALERGGDWVNDTLSFARAGGLGLLGDLSGRGEFGRRFSKRLLRPGGGVREGSVFATGDGDGERTWDDRSSSPNGAASLRMPPYFSSTSSIMSSSPSLTWYFQLCSSARMSAFRVSLPSSVFRLLWGVGARWAISPKDLIGVLSLFGIEAKGGGGGVEGGGSS